MAPGHPSPSRSNKEPLSSGDRYRLWAENNPNSKTELCSIVRLPNDVILRWADDLIDIVKDEARKKGDEEDRKEEEKHAAHGLHSLAAASEPKPKPKTQTNTLMSTGRRVPEHELMMPSDNSIPQGHNLFYQSGKVTPDYVISCESFRNANRLPQVYFPLIVPIQKDWQDYVIDADCDPLKSKNPYEYQRKAHEVNFHLFIQDNAQAVQDNAHPIQDSPQSIQDSSIAVTRCDHKPFLNIITSSNTGHSTVQDYCRASFNETERSSGYNVIFVLDCDEDVRSLPVIEPPPHDPSTWLQWFDRNTTS